MRRIWQAAGGWAKFANANVFLLIAILSTVGSLVGCVKYKAYDSSPTGIFYPYRPVIVRGRDANDVLSIRTNLYTIQQPVKISEVGIATYYDPENAGEHEVARLEFQNCSVYVWTSTLRAAGTIQFNGNQGVALKLWTGFKDFFKYLWELAKVLVGLVILLAIGTAIQRLLSMS